jgi:hypothetical protein
MFEKIVGSIAGLENFPLCVLNVAPTESTVLNTHRPGYFAGS